MTVSKGPWRVDWADPDWPVVRDAQGREIAAIGNDQRTPVMEDQSNANAIAAVPDLLTASWQAIEALRRVQRDILGTDENKPVDAEGAPLFAISIVAEEMVRKAIDAVGGALDRTEGYP